MFATFDYDDYPIVNILFSKTIDNSDHFDAFLNDWMHMYFLYQDFMFIFDTRKIEYIPIQYAFKMAFFIRILREKNYPYLKKSLILVNNNLIKYLLNITFSIQSPVSPVYIWNTDTNNYEIIKNKLLNANNTNMDNDLIYIKPNNSLIPFL
jgi:hypothetical protein